jgi:hypothetical protein
MIESKIIEKYKVYKFRQILEKYDESGDFESLKSELKEYFNNIIDFEQLNTKKEIFDGSKVEISCGRRYLLLNNNHFNIEIESGYIHGHRFEGNFEDCYNPFIDLVLNYDSCNIDNIENYNIAGHIEIHIIFTDMEKALEILKWIHYIKDDNEKECEDE